MDKSVGTNAFPPPGTTHSTALHPRKIRRKIHPRCMIHLQPCLHYAFLLIKRFTRNGKHASLLRRRESSESCSAFSKSARKLRVVVWPTTGSPGEVITGSTSRSSCWQHCVLRQTLHKQLKSHHTPSVVSFPPSCSCWPSLWCFVASSATLFCINKYSISFHHSSNVLPRTCV